MNSSTKKWLKIVLCCILATLMVSSSIAAGTALDGAEENELEVITSTEAETQGETVAETQAETETQEETQTETQVETQTDVSVEGEYILGDVNYDSSVNLLDAIAIQKFSLSMVAFTDIQKQCGDVDGNEAVNLLDSIMIQKFALGMLSKDSEIGNCFTPANPTDATDPTTTQPTEPPTQATEPATTPTDPITVPTDPTEADTVELDKTALTLGVGEKYTLIKSSPTGSDLSDAVFASNNPEVAAVDAETGEITAVQNGTAIITITTRNGAVAECMLTVKNSPTSISLNKTAITLGVGETFDLNSSLLSGEAAYHIAYSSDNAEVASVISSGGLVTANKTGTATVTATAYNGVKVNCTVTVRNAPTKLKLNATSLTLGVGEIFDLNSSMPKGEAAYHIAYSSDNEEVAGVKRSGGLVTANKTGTATVTATAYNGVQVSCTVTVKLAPTEVRLSETSVSLGNGKESTISYTLKAGSYARDIEWTSSDTSVAAVKKATETEAVITAKGRGTATVTLSLYNGVTAQCIVTVTAIRVYLSPSNQNANTYICGNTNEMVQCNKIAECAKLALERNGFEVKKAPQGQEMNKSIEESNAWGADMHLPIHTNGFVGKNMGTTIMVYKAEGEAIKAAQALLNSVGAISPGKDFPIMERPGLKELNSVKALPVYIEVEFHDTIEGATWIINNTKNAGEAIAKGVCDYYGVKYSR